MKKIALILLALLMTLSLAACADKTVEESTTEPETVFEPTTAETTVETISGKLIAVKEGESLTNEFYCSGGTVTPERIAAGFTGWTGINFSLTSEVDESAKTIKITWKATSAMVTGDYENANDGFEFDSTDAMKKFMTDSLTQSIKNNMGDYEITFTTAE